MISTALFFRNILPSASTNADASSGIRRPLDDSPATCSCRIIRGCVSASKDTDLTRVCRDPSGTRVGSSRVRPGHRHTIGHCATDPTSRSDPTHSCSAAQLAACKFEDARRVLRSVFTKTATTARVYIIVCVCVCARACWPACPRWTTSGLWGCAGRGTPR
jgi:hypothetical protein